MSFKLRSPWIAAGAAASFLLVALAVKFSGDPKTQTAGTKGIPVSVSQARVMEFNDDFSTQGSIRALRYASVTPKVDGTILEIYVREGDRVKRGDPLFKSDNVRQEEALKMAQRDLEAASFATEERQEALIRAKADLERVELDYQRFAELLKEGAISQSMFDDVFTRYRQARAMVRSAESMLSSARSSLRKAQAALGIEEKNYRDTTVYAPMDGMVSKRMAEPGEMGRPGVPVLRIDDPSSLEVQAFLPAELYPKVWTGKTSITLEDPSGLYREELTVTTKAPVVDPVTRTFEVRCRTQGSPYKVPGAMARLTVHISSRKSTGVPSKGVVQKEAGPAVYVISGDTAIEVPVATALRSNGWTEITSGDVKEGMVVAVDGASMLSNRSKVKIVRRIP
ncbi:efflux RND transporter periplasmic adaptor subunit [Thermanaerovibrio velox]|nr:efflux RND transporter periplasmic adaptor subunit [Thermanaerovibrio velox]